ncbi:glycerophosphodiester phosphodiesterase [Bdellovibrio sp. HCB2-146]|uniref:glycerophosphodiester phosphodiesterase n=1 Tax=Bdellovibrio sp. HCB2-146 TaxID=3394362 RepID=UPI0039BC329B
MIFLVIVAVVFLFLFIRQKTWKPLPWPPGALRPPAYQGHRGYWKGGAQENTMAAFRAAAERGLQMFELDVRLCKGNVPVVFHDTDLKRIGHRNQNVLDLTADELQNYVNAPTLESVLQATDIPMLINIELKTNRAWDGTLEKEVAALVRKYRAEKRVLFSSFNPLAIWRLKRIIPEVPRALLASQEDEPENKIYLKKLWLAPYIGVNALHLDQNYWREKEVQAFLKRKIPVALWTVNDQKLAEKLLQAGAISIISDTLL